MKVAFVYDRVNTFGGAERVLGVLHQIWPDAPVFTSVYDPEGAPWADGWDVRTSFLQKIPRARNNHRAFGWLMPLAFESLDLSGFDVVISVTSEAAKGIVTRSGQLHVCYLLTPTRYLWSHASDYLNQLPRAVRPLALAVQSRLRMRDYAAGQRPDHIFAISDHVRKRCLKYYRRKTKVIYPPIMLGRHPERPAGRREVEGSGLPSGDDLDRPDATSGLDSSASSRLRRDFARNDAEDYYLTVSRLVPYKRIDVAIEACNRLNANLVIIGSGSDEPRLRSMAGPTIRFAGNLTDEELVEYYRRAGALLLPQEEDFGLAAVEALSFGTPVVGYRQSGVAEIVTDEKTGVLFDHQTAESLVEGLKRMDRTKILRKNCRKRAEKFSEEKFKKNFKQHINALWDKR